MIREILHGEEAMKPTKFQYDDIDQYIVDLKDTLEATEDLQYLCSNQIGIDVSMFAIKATDGIMVFINPAANLLEDIDAKIIMSKEVSFIDGKQYIVPRNSKVTAYYLTEEKKAASNIFEDDMAAIYSKLLDLSCGVDCSQYGLEIDNDFNSATDEEQQEIFAEYLSALDELSNKLDSELSANEDTKKAWTQFKFNQAAAKGEIEFESLNKPNRKARRLLEKMKKRGN